MNRKERRAATKRSQAGGGSPGSAQTRNCSPKPFAIINSAGNSMPRRYAGRCWRAMPGTPALHLLGVIAMQRGLPEEAVAHLRKAAGSRPDIAIGHHSLGKALAAAIRPDAAAAAFERAVALQPDFAEAHKDLGVMLMALGRLKEASAHFARALELVPQLAENFGDTVSTLLGSIPHSAKAWRAPRRRGRSWSPANQLLDAAGWAAIADDAMLLGVLTTTPVRDLALERFLTAVRAAVLERAAARPKRDPRLLEFCSALARQCFNNEYVFTESAERVRARGAPKQAPCRCVEGQGAIPPLRIVAVASYRPLSSLPHAGRLLERAWPEAVDKLLTQQIREVDEERRMRANIPRLTPIEGETTAAVRRQYEENPYPRWVVASSQPEPMTVDDYFKGNFPFSPFRPLGYRGGVDILIAGCGSGEHSIGTARRYKAPRCWRSISAYRVSLTRNARHASSAWQYRICTGRRLGARNDRPFVRSDRSERRAASSVGSRCRLARAAQAAAARRIDAGRFVQRARARRYRRRPPVHRRAWFDATAADIRRCRQEMLAPHAGAGEVSGLLQHQRMPRSAVPRAGASVHHPADQGISQRGARVPRIRIQCRRVAGIPNAIP